MVESQNNFSRSYSVFMQVQLVTHLVQMRFCFPSKTKTTSSDLNFPSIVMTSMQSIVTLNTVQPLEEVMTCIYQTTQTPISTPTQILVVHTNLLQATLTALPTPELFWLALTTSVHLKQKSSTYNRLVIPTLITVNMRSLYLVM